MLNSSLIGISGIAAAFWNEHDSKLLGLLHVSPCSCVTTVWCHRIHVFILGPIASLIPFPTRPKPAPWSHLASSLYLPKTLNPFICDITDHPLPSHLLPPHSLSFSVNPCPLPFQRVLNEKRWGPASCLTEGFVTLLALWLHTPATCARSPFDVHQRHCIRYLRAYWMGHSGLPSKPPRPVPGEPLSRCDSASFSRKKCVSEIITFFYKKIHVLHLHHLLILTQQSRKICFCLDFLPWGLFLSRWYQLLLFFFFNSQMQKTAKPAKQCLLLKYCYELYGQPKTINKNTITLVLNSLKQTWSHFPTGFGIALVGACSPGISEFLGQRMS